MNLFQHVMYYSGFVFWGLVFAAIIFLCFEIPARIKAKKDD
jgi:hypothetical protein